MRSCSFKLPTFVEVKLQDQLMTVHLTWVIKLASLGVLSLTDVEVLLRQVLMK